MLLTRDDAKYFTLNFRIRLLESCLRESLALNFAPNGGHSDSQRSYMNSCVIISKNNVFRFCTKRASIQRFRRANFSQRSFRDCETPFSLYLLRQLLWTQTLRACHKSGCSTTGIFQHQLVCLAHYNLGKINSINTGSCSLSCVCFLACHATTFIPTNFCCKRALSLDCHLIQHPYRCWPTIWSCRLRKFF
jgi:hypothetical protein